MNMKIYLLRHGSIQHGDKKRLIGQTDLPLSETGLEQARWWRTTLDVGRMQRVYCSDLVRSRQTAEILCEDENCVLAIRPELREINLGLWDGLRPEEVKERFPGEWDKRGRDFEHYRPPCGESFACLRDRVVPVLEQVASGHDQQVIIVGHAGVNRVILCHGLGMPLNHLFRLGQDYGALNIIEYTEGTWRVSLMNLRPPAVGKL